MNIVGFIASGVVRKSAHQITIEDFEEGTLGKGIFSMPIKKGRAVGCECPHCGNSSIYLTLHDEPNQWYVFCARPQCLQKDAEISKAAARYTSMKELSRQQREAERQKPSGYQGIADYSWCLKVD